MYSPREALNIKNAAAAEFPDFKINDIEVSAHGSVAIFIEATAAQLDDDRLGGANIEPSSWDEAGEVVRYDVFIWRHI